MDTLCNFLDNNNNNTAYHSENFSFSDDNKSHVQDSNKLPSMMMAIIQPNGLVRQ